MIRSIAAPSAPAPAPVPIAFWILSFGIEASRAFWTAVASAALPSVSPPPSRAATVIARASLLKSLPRLASAAPFLCLIDDHFECPDMALILGGVSRPIVEPSPQQRDGAPSGAPSSLRVRHARARRQARPVYSRRPVVYWLPERCYRGLVDLIVSRKQSSVPVPCMLLSSMTSRDQVAFVAFLSPSPLSRLRLSCGA